MVEGCSKLGCMQFSNFAGITFISFFTISNSRCPLSVFNKTSEHPLSSELKFASVFSYPQKSAIVISLGRLILVK